MSRMNVNRMEKSYGLEKNNNIILLILQWQYILSLICLKLHCMEWIQIKKVQREK